MPKCSEKKPALAFPVEPISGDQFSSEIPTGIGFPLFAKLGNSWALAIDVIAAPQSRHSAHLAMSTAARKVGPTCQLPFPVYLPNLPLFCPTCLLCPVLSTADC